MYYSRKQWTYSTLELLNDGYICCIPLNTSYWRMSSQIFEGDVFKLNGLIGIPYFEKGINSKIFCIVMAKITAR